MKTCSFLLRAIIVLFVVSSCTENPYQTILTDTLDVPDNKTEIVNPPDNTTVDCPIPKDAPIKSSYINMRNIYSVPFQYKEYHIDGVRHDYSDFTAGVAWLQCVYQECSGKNSGYVDFNNLRYYFVLKDGSRELAKIVTANDIYGADGYGDPGYGKEYERFTFNVPDESLGKIPMELLKEGSLYYVRMRPYQGSGWDKLYHWWTDRAELPDNLDYIEVTARIRISGSCWVQIGSDFWKNLTAWPTTYGGNNIECCVGDWVGSGVASDWTTIRMSSK